MSFESDPQALKDSLDLSLEDGELRNILYRQGIKLDETVLLSIKIGNTDKVNDYNIPTISPPVDVVQTQIRFDDEIFNKEIFDQEITKFLNNAEEHHKLLTNLYKPSWDPAIEIEFSSIFDIPSQKKTLPFEILLKCCPPRVQ